MKIADWIGVGILVVGVGVGGYLVVKRPGMFNGNVVPAGGPDQSKPPTGSSLAQTPPSTSTANQDRTLADIAAGVGLAKQGIAMAKDLFEAFESFGD